MLSGFSICVRVYQLFNVFKMQWKKARAVGSINDKREFLSKRKMMVRKKVHYDQGRRVICVGNIHLSAVQFYSLKNYQLYFSFTSLYVVM